MNSELTTQIFSHSILSTASQINKLTIHNYNFSCNTEGNLTQRLKAKQVDDKKQVPDMISKLVDDPEKFKEILRKYKENQN